MKLLRRHFGVVAIILKKKRDMYIYKFMPELYIVLCCYGIFYFVLVHHNIFLLLLLFAYLLTICLFFLGGYRMIQKPKDLVGYRKKRAMKKKWRHQLRFFYNL